MPRARKKVVTLDPTWVQATLEDAAEALGDLIREIDPRDSGADVEMLLQDRMPTVFAKLNYAWNSRKLGASAHESVDHDVLVGWPTDLDLQPG
jgi:hypothetical protein